MRPSQSGKPLAAAWVLLLVGSAFALPQQPTPAPQRGTDQSAGPNPVVRERAIRRQRAKLEQRLILAERSVARLGELHEYRLRRGSIQP